MLVGMKTLIQTLFYRIASTLRKRCYLQLEFIALRLQVAVVKRSAKRPRFDPANRCLWVLLAKWWSKWPQALEIMQAETVRRWRRQGIWYHMGWRRGHKRPGRAPIPTETRNLIWDMSRDNVLWGAPRICGELAKLGINLSPTTVAKYKVRRSYPPSPTWRAVMRNHPDLIVAEVYSELSARFRAVLGQCLERFRGGLVGQC